MLSFVNFYLAFLIQREYFPIRLACSPNYGARQRGQNEKFLGCVHTKFKSVFISPARQLRQSLHCSLQANRESHRSYPAVCDRRVYV